jgi:hypothetical protein
MDYVTHNKKKRINVNRTSHQGYIKAAYGDLKKAFGAPLPGDGKADAEWIIRFEDGLVATIYNYKDGKNYLGRRGMSKTKITEWNIGGKSARAVDYVRRILSGPKKAVKPAAKKPPRRRKAKTTGKA